MSAMILIVSLACDGKLVIYVGDGLEGEWQAEFSAQYFGQATPEDGDGSYTIAHTSRLSISDGSLEVFIDPPIPPLFGWGESQAYWSCLYFISDDSLILTSAETSEEIERYKFEISGDTLHLYYIPQSSDPADSMMVAIPLYGGLPWGRAFMWHSGDFVRLRGGSD
ncbi:MAG: hypothetical protein GWO41_12490 [candidate division Zixibacteria bacterium]|nr:hypothetical protein [candidate division Zixibacteria bacterium]NIR67272.1 hypothetical protein [candidate division Zixibacteria bacterium]NIS16108.1 hypothetical protein [candidate division Zixibacteria bacterium]NIS48655.1 hypothetical protein [candidate division Zixibacteria bacterium]NIT53522.1 hypothetical protein [candidate division Zixibacteria bacterium]